MTILNDLHAASFKGATFLVKSTSTSAGRKTAIHEYPNTDRRFVEDLGKMNGTFSIEGIVHGVNYFANRDSLIEALESAGPGELVHPFFGNITVVAQPYTLVEETTTLGIAKFSMVFDQTEESVFPKKATNNVSLINDQKDSVISSVESDLSSTFSVSRSSPVNFTDAQTIITSIGNSFEINSDTIFKVTSNISDFTDNLNTFRNNTIGNVFNPTRLASNLTSLFGSFETLGSTSENQFDITKLLFNFGSDQETLTASTLQQIERSKNRKILNSAVRANALAQAYDVTTQLTFDTDDDVKDVQDTLDEQFEFVVNDNNLSDDTITKIKDLRVEVRKFLEQESVNAFKISEVFTNEISATILTYQYYGKVDNTQKIIDLNNSLDPTFIQDTVKILS